MNPIGFSTGALARGDVANALATLAETNVETIELSALRTSELRPLLEYCFAADLSKYRHISVHAPSNFDATEERHIVDLLDRYTKAHWLIVVHPDAIHDPGCWSRFGSRLLVENMDKRKRIGRSVEELSAVFRRLPSAQLCFDIAHARQFDSSMTEAYRILTVFAARIRQIHLSDVSSSSKHDRLSVAAIRAYRQVAHCIPPEIPVVLESPVADEELGDELAKARASLEPTEQSLLTG